MADSTNHRKEELVWLMAHLAEPLMRNRGLLHGGRTVPKGIRVRAISPGPLAARAALMAKAQAKGASRGLVSIDDVGRAVAFLALDGAKLMTGDTIYIDSGYHVID